MSILFPEQSDFELFDDRQHSFSDVFAKEDPKKSFELVGEILNCNSSGNDVLRREKLPTDVISDSEIFCHAENSPEMQSNDATEIPHHNDVLANSTEEKLQMDVSKDAKDDVNRYDTITVDNDGNIICVDKYDDDVGDADNEENDTNHEEISIKNDVVFNTKNADLCTIENSVASDVVINSDDENVENDVVGNYRDIFRALFLLLSKAHDTWRSDGFSLQFRGWTTQPE